MKYLLQSEKKILDYCNSKRELAKYDKGTHYLITLLSDFLKTIDELRGAVQVEKEINAQIWEQLRARTTAYEASVVERTRLLTDVKFLREQIERLKK